MYYGPPTLSAPTYFATRAVEARAPSPLPVAAGDAASRVVGALRASYPSFEELLSRNHTRAFVWIQDDAIVYERYFERVTANTQLPAFSMSKTFAALLVGCAVSDGLVDSVDDRMTSYLPELAAKPGYGSITIDHLLRMTSGIDFVEDSYDGAALYYSTDLRARMYSYPVRWTPGTHYLYGSISTQLLWDVLHRRLGGRSVAGYFEERLWKPIGAESAASWSLDSEKSGIEKLAGGFSATTRDHARIGLLFLHEGTLDGRTVVPASWVRASVTLDPVPGVVETTDGRVRRGKYQWFRTLDDRSYFAKGYHGQYVFVVPERRSVFVRFGDDYGDIDWPALFLRLADSRGEDPELRVTEPRPTEARAGARSP